MFNITNISGNLNFSVQRLVDAFKTLGAGKLNEAISTKRLTAFYFIAILK